MCLSNYGTTKPMWAISLLLFAPVKLGSSTLQCTSQCSQGKFCSIPPIPNKSFWFYFYILLIMHRKCSYSCFDKCLSSIISNISCQNSYKQQIQTITKAEGKEIFLLLFLMVTVGNEEVSCACSIPLCG